MTKVLGIDSSSIVAAAAVLSEDKLLAEYIVNSKKMHSEKMMLIVDKVLKDSETALKELDAIGVAKGPGSFTGIRIGMACAQGMAHALGKPIIGINTLDGLAYNYNLMDAETLICPMINAQRKEIYTSLYRWDEGKLNRLWDYRLIKADLLAKELFLLKEKVIVLGDGVFLLKEVLNTCNIGSDCGIIFANPAFSMPRASSIAAAALDKYMQGEIDSCFSIKPFYIRKSSAEEKQEERYGTKSR